MSLLSLEESVISESVINIDIVKMLFPGLITLISISVAILTFLLVRYVSVSHLPEGRIYRNLAWFMIVPLIIGIIGSILSLLFLFGICDVISDKASLVYFISILFGICILLIIIGVIKTFNSITRG